MLPAAEEEKRIGGEEPVGQILVLNENRLEPSEVIFASEGETALKLMNEEDVDLLIADVPRFDLRRTRRSL